MDDHARAVGASVLPLVMHPDPRLRQTCAGLPDDALALATSMLATMYAAQGRGLAAPQVGRPFRMFVMDVTWKEGEAAPLVALDPVLSEPSETLATHTESCLSIDGVAVAVTRPAEVTLAWTDLAGAPRRQRLTGMAAVCAQHEMDHLDGVLILDHQPGRPGMLELRPNCECCDRDLPPAAEALICTYECTFCPGCAAAMGGVCPNCGGTLAARPVRTPEKLARDPASTLRVHHDGPCGIAAA